MLAVNIEDASVNEQLDSLSSSESIEDEDLICDIYALIHYSSTVSAAGPSDTGALPLAEGRRYFQDTLLCYECRKTGHLARDCEEKVATICGLCGTAGHKRTSCPQRICRNCENTGHDEKSCRKRPVASEHRKCKYAKHHSAQDCPSFYRTYIINKEPVVSRRTCALCFSSSHFTSDCSDSRKHSNATAYTKDILARSRTIRKDVDNKPS